MNERRADDVGAAGRTTMNAVDIVNASVSPDYVPAGATAYPEDEIGRRFKLTAQMLTADVGTNHGHAAPMILVGRNVQGGLHGQ